MSTTPHCTRIAAAVALALLLLGAARLLFVVWHAPMAGYANQYDMARTSACLGLWPDVPEAERALAHVTAPRSDYRYGGARGDICYPSTDVALAALAIGADRAVETLRGRDARDLDLRQLGTLKALLLIAIALALDRRLRRHGGWRVAHATVFALLIADPFNALYANTLYTESGALIAGYAAFALVAHFALGAAATPWTIAAFAVAIAALGLARVQHLALPLGLAIVAALALWSRRERIAVAAAVWIAVSLAVPLVQMGTQGEQTSIAAANRSNTVFGAVLPAASDLEAMTARIGLPPPCASLTYTTWYVTRGRDAAAECPQIAGVSRARIAVALLADPTAALRLAGRAITFSTAWRLPYVGEVAAAQFARVPMPSFADVLAPRGFVFHVTLWLAPALLALAALVRLAARRPRGADAVLVAAVVCAGLTWASSVLGDGFSELARHLHVAQNAIVVAWVVLLARVVDAVRRKNWRRGLSVLAAVLAAAGVGAAWRTLPMTHGLLDAPATIRLDGDRVEVTGWALSPVGVTKVQARFAGQRAELALSRSAGLDLYFPIAGGGRAQAFAGSIGAPAQEGWLEIHATDARGATVRIDRQWLSRAGTPPNG